VEKVLGQPRFEYLRSHPDEGALFDAAMADLSRGESEAIAAAYDFSGYRHIVDVAGGSGTLLASILRDNPGATGVLFDRPEVTKLAEELRAVAGLCERMTIVAGDFFDEILLTTRLAIPEHARLVLFERLLIPDNAPSQAKTMDLLMHLLFGGRERTRPDFEQLLTDSGFRLSAIDRAGSALYAIEAVPV
jgi:hypothetical protein